MNLYLIRHGESVVNAREQIGDDVLDCNVGLSEKGRAQARASANAFADALRELPEKTTKIYVSPYKRARETFKEFDKILFLSERYPIAESTLISEIDIGLFFFLTRDELEAKCAVEYEHWKRMVSNGGSFFAKYPMGESPMEVSLRCRQFIGELNRDAGEAVENAVIFSHGTFIRVFVMTWFGYDHEWYEKNRIPGNGWIRKIDEKNDYGYMYSGEKQ